MQQLGFGYIGSEVLENILFESYDLDFLVDWLLEKATDVTESVWPFSVCSGTPVVASQTRTVLSSEADASRVPSVEKATDVTEFVWPFSVYNISNDGL